MFNYSLLPTHIQDGMRQHVEHGHHVGGFLTAVLSNDLKESLGRADSECREKMFDIVSFLYNEVPSLCWGSEKKVKEWRDHKGVQGLELTEETQNGTANPC